MDGSPPSSSVLCPWDFAGKNTGVGCHFLLQQIFRTQELNLGLLHCRQILYYLSHQREVSSTSTSQGPPGGKSLKVQFSFIFFFFFKPDFWIKSFYFSQRKKSKRPPPSVEGHSGVRLSSFQTGHWDDPWMSFLLSLLLSWCPWYSAVWALIRLEGCL